MKLPTPVRAGITLCAVPVAVFSAYSQFETGRLARIPAELAWVFPVATDAAAFVATLVWQSAQYPRKIRRYAAFIVFMCVAMSVAGAALHVGITSNATPNNVIPTPRWLGYAAGSIPSIALAMLIHLGAMIASSPEDAAEKEAAAKAEAKAAKAVKPPPPRPSPKPRPARTRPQTAGAAEHVRPPTSAAPVSKPEPVLVPAPVQESPVTEHETDPKPESTPESTPEVGTGSTTDRMLDFLRVHAAPHTVTGADLDREFGTRNYGARVIRRWKKQQEPTPRASGE